MECPLVILVMADRYLPGYKGGGPIRSLSNLIAYLGDENRFKILTRDRDVGDLIPYREIEIGSWKRVGKAEVRYLGPKEAGIRGIRRAINRTPHEVLYVNSFFSPAFSVLPLLLRRLKLTSTRSVIVAPRGEFAAGALGLKRAKKFLYLFAARAIGLCRNVCWQATNQEEAREIRKHFGTEARIFVAPNLPAAAAPNQSRATGSPKRSGELRVIFCSRIARKKNLKFALARLQEVEGSVEFTILGPIEDSKYWSECQELMRQLPENVSIHLLGGLPHDQALEKIAEHHLFFLPTLGENYGHVIFEALLVGCPALISDQTPWRGLEARGIGWDLPIEKQQSFRRALQACIDMDSITHSKMAARATAFAMEMRSTDSLVAENRRMFERILSD
jgi:glycosyltransferase involved in cell wall biosynthesis